LAQRAIAAPAPPRAQNLALNIAEKGFPISVFNRSGDKTDAAVARARKSGLQNLHGYKDLGEFVQSLERPRCERPRSCAEHGAAGAAAP
jgi:hypothetical protein